MIKMELKAKYNNDQIINVVFNKEKTVEINTSGDVELTEFVKELTQLIKEDVELDFSGFECEDSKLLLIQNTIREIVKSFNQSITDIDESNEEDDILF